MDVICRFRRSSARDCHRRNDGGFLPAIILQLKKWSADFAEMLGNFQHNPDRVKLVLAVTERHARILPRDRARTSSATPRKVWSTRLLTAEIGGDRLTEEEIIANSIVTMVGGQETTTNLIGNGLLTLLIRNPERNESSCETILPSLSQAVEEFLRYESPSQHTARIAP